jgi:hypothetical protein
MSLFSRLSENRFPKDRGFTNVGPGSYEVPTCLDEKGVLIREGRDRFEENSEASFSIFIDEADAERPVRTPRGLRPSTKENIVGSSRARSKSLGNRSEPGDEKAKTVDTSITRKNSTLSDSSVKLQAQDRSIAELQKRVEELETEGRDAHNTITGLRAKVEENERARQAQGTEQPLAGSQAPALDGEALRALVEQLVYQHLETPRQVLSLWREQAAKTHETHCKLKEENCKLKEDAAGAEMQAKKSELKLAVAEEKVVVAEEKVVVAEDVARQQEAEVTRLSAELEATSTQASATAEEAESLRQLVCALQMESQKAAEIHLCALQLESQKAAETAKALEVSQLEEQRLQEMLAISQLEQERLREMRAVLQDAIDRYKEREANMAGHVNHKQKIRYTIQMKKENAALQEEVNRLQQQVLHLERQLVATKANTSGHKSSVRKQLLSQPECRQAEGEAARASVEPSVADLAAVAKEVAQDFQLAARTTK